MSNDVSNTPLIVDTAAATVIVTRKIWVTSIRWEVGDAPTDGDAAVVQNGAGRVFWNSVLREFGTGAAVVPPVETVFSEPQPLNGVIVPTLAGGTLYIYYKEGRR